MSDINKLSVKRGNRLVLLSWQNPSLRVKLLQYGCLKFEQILLSIIRYKFVCLACQKMCDYRQVSNITRTESQHLKYSRTVLRLSLPNPLKPDVKSRMKM